MLSDQVVVEPGIIASGSTVYFNVHRPDGKVYDTTTNDTFNAPNLAVVTDCDVAMPQVGGTSQYQGTFPSTLPSGVYTVLVKVQAGASPNFEDEVKARYRLYWDGTYLNDPAVAATVSAQFVNDSHRWRYEAADQLTAVNVINESIGFDGLVAFNFNRVIPGDVTINSAVVTGLTPDTGTGADIDLTGNAQVALSGREVHVPIHVYGDGTFTVTLQITTSDSQVLVRHGVIKTET